MKKEFENPELSIYYLKTADVIATSITEMPDGVGDNDDDIEDLLGGN